ncbi:MAG: AAA family ATPase [bacterium]
MELIEITIGGFKNLKRTTINFLGNNIISLIAPNNYGKSNFLDGIDFAQTFIHSSTRQRKELLNSPFVIPINKFNDTTNFYFEFIARLKENKKDQLIKYSLELEWAKTKQKNPGKVISESFSIKGDSPNSKFKLLFRRNQNNATYLSSPKGRCDTQILINDDELLLNKLSNYDSLFYNYYLKSFLSIDLHISKLFDIDFFVGGINITNNPSSDLDDGRNILKFLYFLKKDKPSQYQLLINSLIDLIPEIEYIKPIEIDLKKVANDKNLEDPPFELPEKIYDLRVKEINNNQETSIVYLSTGTKRILAILALAVSKDDNNTCLLAYEELENSIHPSLLQKLLIILTEIASKVKILISSHSPYLIQYLPLDSAYLGLPNKKGLAGFSKLKSTKQKSILNIVSEENISLGDYLFDLLLQPEIDKNFLDEYFNYQVGDF